MERFTESPEETEALGARLGRRLRPGQGIALLGEMGSGKTVFTRGIAKGMGVEEADQVRSPSYLLMIEYPGPVPLYHFDAYFAAKEMDFLADGGEVLLQGDGVAVVEWADRLGSLLPGHFLQVRFAWVPRREERRVLTLAGQEEEWGEILAGLA